MVHGINPLHSAMDYNSGTRPSVGRVRLYSIEPPTAQRIRPRSSYSNARFTSGKSIFVVLVKELQTRRSFGRCAPGRDSSRI